MADSHIQKSDGIFEWFFFPIKRFSKQYLETTVEKQTCSENSIFFGLVSSVKQFRKEP